MPFESGRELRRVAEAPLPLALPDNRRALNPRRDRRARSSVSWECTSAPATARLLLRRLQCASFFCAHLVMTLLHMLHCSFLWNQSVSYRMPAPHGYAVSCGLRCCDAEVIVARFRWRSFACTIAYHRLSFTERISFCRYLLCVSLCCCVCVWWESAVAADLRHVFRHRRSSPTQRSRRAPPTRFPARMQVLRCDYLHTEEGHSARRQEAAPSEPLRGWPACLPHASHERCPLEQ